MLQPVGPIANVWDVMRTNRARYSSQKERESRSHRDQLHAPLRATRSPQFDNAAARLSGQLS